LNLLVLNAAALAKPEAISEEDARRYYERVSGTRYGAPEKRALQQIVFASMEEANAASENLRNGTSFEDIAKERGIDEATLNLGELTKGEMLDPAVAEAAFALPEGGASEPIAGRFGPVLVRASRIQPGSVKPFDEVRDDAKGEVAIERARLELQRVHDAIEDQRASAKPLKDIAAERGLVLRSIAGVDRQGRDKTGQTVPDLPEAAPLLQAAFRSDVGADSEAIRTGGDGYVWFEVTNVEPARDRSLAEEKDRVASDWRTEEVSRKLGERARELKTRVEAGEAMGKIAGELGIELETATEVRRNAPGAEPPRAVVTRAFATPVGKVADVAIDAGRALFRVTAATMPPYVTTTQQAEALEDQLRRALADDVLTEYISVVEKQVGVSTNPENMRRAIGGES
jgi:peptidyl-prolyl cis-trans isomerase D